MSRALQPAAPARTALPLPLLALALAAFAIGTTEFVIVGLLPAVAADTGTRLPQAGLLVTGYALGVAFGAPPLAALTARAAPFNALSALMLLFVAGNAMCALAPDYGWLMAGRIVASLTHGAFFGLGATVAAALVPPQRRAAAIALMFSGLGLGNLLGGWAADRWPVGAMAAILAALAAVELALHWVLPQPSLVMAGAVLWGMAAFATAPGLQSRVLHEAADAPALASTLNIAAFNLGNAGAAWLGGEALRRGFGLERLPLLSAVLALAALVLLAVMEWPRRGAARAA